MVAEQGPFSQTAGWPALRPELSRSAPTVAANFYPDYRQMLVRSRMLSIVRSADPVTAEDGERPRVRLNPSVLAKVSRRGDRVHRGRRPSLAPRQRSYTAARAVGGARTQAVNDAIRGGGGWAQLLEGYAKTVANRR
jgi:hypothetical protein